MKYLVYQYYREPNTDRLKKDRPGVYIKSDYEYYEYSKKSTSKYAEKVGAEYKFFNHPLPGNISPFFGIFLPFMEKWCHDYDAVCFLDSDIMATVNAKNIFDVASKEDISANMMNTAARWRKQRQFEWFSSIGGHFNSGVVVFPKPVYNKLIDFTSTIGNRHEKRGQVENSIGSFDQAQLNMFIKKENKYLKLDDEFNYHLGRKKHEYRFDMSLIHYHRHNKPMMRQDFDDKRILK